MGDIFKLANISEEIIALKLFFLREAPPQPKRIAKQLKVEDLCNPEGLKPILIIELLMVILRFSFILLRDSVSFIYGILETTFFGILNTFSSKKLHQIKFDLNEEIECSICLEIFKKSEKVIKLKCSHMYHPGCLALYLESYS